MGQWKVRDYKKECRELDAAFTRVQLQLSALQHKHWETLSDGEKELLRELIAIVSKLADLRRKASMT